MTTPAVSYYENTIKENPAMQEEYRYHQWHAHYNAAQIEFFHFNDGNDIYEYSAGLLVVRKPEPNPSWHAPAEYLAAVQIPLSAAKELDLRSVLLEIPFASMRTDPQSLVNLVSSPSLQSILICRFQSGEEYRYAPFHGDCRLSSLRFFLQNIALGSIKYKYIQDMRGQIFNFDRLKALQLQDESARPGQEIIQLKYRSDGTAKVMVPVRKIGKRRPLLSPSLILYRPDQDRFWEYRCAAIQAGRAPDADFFCDHPHCSRRHAEFISRCGQWYIKDHSANGTFLNGQRINKDTLCLLKPGDEISFAKKVTVIYIPEINEQNNDVPAAGAIAANTSAPPENLWKELDYIGTHSDRFPGTILYVNYKCSLHVMEDANGIYWFGYMSPYAVRDSVVLSRSDVEQILSLIRKCDLHGFVMDNMYYNTDYDDCTRLPFSDMAVQYDYDGKSCLYRDEYGYLHREQHIAAYFSELTAQLLQLFAHFKHSQTVSDPLLRLYLPDQQKTVEFRQTFVTVGRARDADFYCHHLLCARRHAVFAYIQDQWYVKDVCSTNGTYLNGRRLDANTFHILRSGDEISFAKCITVHYQSPEQETHK